MKYISALFFIFLLSFQTSQIYADGSCESSCKIINAPEFLVNTINEVRKISKNIESETAKIKSSETNIDKINASMIKAYNSITNWGGYFSSFEYSVSFPITHSVPLEVKRDQRLIEKEAETLKKSLDKIYKKGLSDEVISNVCSGVNVTYINCVGKNGTASELMEKLIQDVYMLNDFYKKSIVGADTQESSSTNYLNAAFFTKMQEFYHENTAEDCSRCEKSFTEKASTAMDKISEIQKGTGKGIQEWVDAWNLLIGKTDNSSKEKELLRNHLGKEGISGSAADNVMKDLENFNSSGPNGGNGFFSTNNNFVTNSFKRLAENVMPQINNFENAVSQTFRNQVTKSEKRDAPIVINDIKKTDDEGVITKNYLEDFGRMYNTQLTYIGVGNEKNKDLEGKIVELHYKLLFTIKSFVDICPITQKICNDQMYGQGNCECKK